MNRGASGFSVIVRRKCHTPKHWGTPQGDEVHWSACTGCWSDKFRTELNHCSIERVERIGLRRRTLHFEMLQIKSPEGRSCKIATCLRLVVAVLEIPYVIPFDGRLFERYRFGEKQRAVTYGGFPVDCLDLLDLGGQRLK